MKLRLPVCLKSIVNKPHILFPLHTAYKSKSKFQARLQQDFGKVFAAIRQKTGVPKHSASVLPFLLFTSRRNKFIADPSGILDVTFADIRQFFIKVPYMGANCIFPTNT